MRDVPSLLNADAVAALRNLIDLHRHAVQLPAPGEWKSKTDNDIWARIVGQVGVVGGSARVRDIREEIERDPSGGASYATLVGLRPSSRRKKINAMLRRHGIRYASATLADCKKTDALVQNLALVISRGGPLNYVRELAAIPDESERIATVEREMAYIKLKGARDWLMGLGLADYAIAIDTRVLKVLKALGVEYPKNIRTDRAAYQGLENELLEKVCRPHGVTGVLLDRVLYQRMDAILWDIAHPTSSRTAFDPERLAAALHQIDPDRRLSHFELATALSRVLSTSPALA